MHDPESSAAPASAEAPASSPSARSRAVALRATLGSAAAFGGLALAYPQAGAASLAAFAALMVVVHWPRARRRTALRGAGPEAPRLWPDQGMKTVIDALGEPVFLVDRDFMLRYRNASALEAFGNMALGDPVSLRLRSPELIAAMELCQRSGEAGEVVLDERRPTDRTWLVTIAPVRAPRGERPRFFLLKFRDRTAETRVERMRTDFVANASHELRTPLASLSGFIETLQGPARDDEVARERFLAIMREQASRMSRLIDDLLSLSRIEMKRHLPDTARADLVRVFDKVADQMRPLAEEHGVSLEYERPERPLRIVGDEDELLQVFANLVENACKYGADGKRIVLKLEAVGGRQVSSVEAGVQDFGPGIAPEHVPRLTERFYRVDVGSSRAMRGTGLGLSIVRNILLRHRSRLVVRSTLGIGSTFSARFPLVRDDMAANGEREGKTKA